MAISKFMKDICVVAKKATLRCLKDKKSIFGKIDLEKFVSEVEKFEYLKKKSFFDLKLSDETCFFEFDIKGFLENFNHETKSFKFSLGKNIKFYRTKKAQEIILKNTELFGSTYAGIYKQLTRTNINRLYRDTKYS